MHVADWEPLAWSDYEQQPTAVGPAPAEGLRSLAAKFGSPYRQCDVSNMLPVLGAIRAQGWHLDRSDLRRLLDQGALDPPAFSLLWEVTSLNLPPALQWAISQRPKRSFERIGHYLQRLQFCAQLAPAQLQPLLDSHHSLRIPHYFRVMALGGDTSSTDPTDPTVLPRYPPPRRLATMQQMAEFDKLLHVPSGFIRAMALCLRARRADVMIAPPQLSIRTGTPGIDALRVSWLLNQRRDLADFLEAHPIHPSDTIVGYLHRLKSQASKDPLLLDLLLVLLPQRHRGGRVSLPTRTAIRPPAQPAGSWRSAARQAGIPERLLRAALSVERDDAPLALPRLLTASLLRHVPQWPPTVDILREVSHVRDDQAHVLLTLAEHPDDVSLILSQPQRRDETDLQYAVRLHGAGMSRDSACRYMFCDEEAFDAQLSRPPLCGGPSSSSHRSRRLAPAVPRDRSPRVAPAATPPAGVRSSAADAVQR